MCLLVFTWQVDPAYPLVVAANRDERLDRPAHPLVVLRADHPRILGGRDDLAGGTWLAVNEHGVVAGLTNRPAPEGRDPTKRSRGELPLVLAGQSSAEAGVAALVDAVQPSQYNPAWLLVGDRDSLYYLELTTDRPLGVRRLTPGIHVLENVPLDEPSPKVDRVHSLVAAVSGGQSLWSVLPSVLADHTVPVGIPVGWMAGGDSPRLPATLAACVHSEGYGTRSATLVRIPVAPTTPPEMLVADGPPCTVPFVDVTSRWDG